jgi:hypothetical protein
MHISKPIRADSLLEAMVDVLARGQEPASGPALAGCA